MILGFIGYGGAGKSTAAAYLRTRHNFATPHIGYPLKAMLRALLTELGYDAETIDRYIDGDLKREVIPDLGVTSTYAQQTLGTDWGRNIINPRLWLDAWCCKIDEHLAAGRGVTSESVRFANEADEIRARGGIIVEIKRPGVGPLPGGHVSEILPCDPDVSVWNDGPPEILHARIEGVLDRHFRQSSSASSSRGRGKSSGQRSDSVISGVPIAVQTLPCSSVRDD